MYQEVAGVAVAEASPQVTKDVPRAIDQQTSVVHELVQAVTELRALLDPALSDAHPQPTTEDQKQSEGLSRLGRALDANTSVAQESLAIVLDINNRMQL
jgi:hypothetical protein